MKNAGHVHSLNLYVPLVEDYFDRALTVIAIQATTAFSTSAMRIVGIVFHVLPHVLNAHHSPLALNVKVG